jgi:hypothetical protein
MIGNFSISLNNLTSLITSSALLESNSSFLNNIFINNKAKLGGAAIAINGFNLSNLTSSDTSGSC